MECIETPAIRSLRTNYDSHLLACALVIAAPDARPGVIRTIAHKLAGSAAMFGYSAVAEAAGRLDAAFQTGAGLAACREGAESLLAAIAVHTATPRIPQA